MLAQGIDHDTVGANPLAGMAAERIVVASRIRMDRVRQGPNSYGDGRNGARILDHLISDEAITMPHPITTDTSRADAIAGEQSPGGRP